MYQTVTDTLVVITLAGINILFLAILNKLNILTHNVMIAANREGVE